MRYPAQTIKLAKHLRILGSTYAEIKSVLGLCIAKATLCHWCKDVPLPPEYAKKVRMLNEKSWAKARSISIANRKQKREEFFQEIARKNTPIAEKIRSQNIAKIALAILCLGEASKYKRYGTGPFALGSSDPRIITLFLLWLRQCFPFDINKVRCRLQCRADQNVKVLMKFWIGHTKISRNQFYPTYIDKRTIGKPTMKKEYKGVLLVMYIDVKVQLELESLAQIIYNTVRVTQGP